ncbi:putative metal-binding motif-containing protein, partial [Candidatus Woesearchaeota archaeon]|nr:putative metal-binding motif-containing protein [Candidatus Woesearchaeota archaeon]
DNPSQGGAAIHPGAVEICDNVDQNCDGVIDSITNPSGCDQDGECSGAVKTCNKGLWGTCNKLPTTEICDNKDNDCDIFKDNAPGTPYSNTLTSSSSCNQVGYCSGAKQTCTNGVWSTCSKLPQAERCNSVDDNCNGQIDDGVKNAYYFDNDGDGYGAGSPIYACSSGYRQITNNQDCNDNDAAIKPGATESCDGRDNNCDGRTDFANSIGDLDNSCGSDFSQANPYGYRWVSLDGSYGCKEKQLQEYYNYDRYCNEGSGCTQSQTSSWRETGSTRNVNEGGTCYNNFCSGSVLGYSFKCGGGTCSGYYYDCNNYDYCYSKYWKVDYSCGGSPAGCNWGWNDCPKNTCPSNC